MKKISSYKIVAVLSLCLVSLDIEAKEVSEKEKESVFNFDIFSLTKKKESAFDTASATYVLSSEDIRRSGMTSIPEALRLVPGIQVARMDGNKWAISSRGFNRQYSNKLLVMIDGRTVYTNLFSGIFWDINDYVIEDVDRIEVVRGSGGSIWGANAVNGIINIITKNAAETKGAYVSQIVGSQDRSITEARYGGETASKDNYRFYVKKAIRDGLNKKNDKGRNFDGSNQDMAGFRYDVTSIKDSSISIHGDIFDGKAQNYFSTLSGIANADKNSKGANIAVNWDKKLSNKSNFILNSYFDYDQFDAVVLKRSAKTLDVDFQHFYNFSKDNQFIWGLGYRDMIDDIEETNVTNTAGTLSYIPINYTPDNRNDELFSAFIQEKYGLIADKLYLTVGSKFSINDFTGFEFQPNARLTYYPSKNQTLWSAISRSVRTPTRGEDGFTIKSGTSGSVSNQGSTTVNSEEVVSYEAGYRIKPNHKTLLDISTFFSQYSNLKTYEGANRIANNMGSGESYGFEVMGKWQVTNDWRMEASYDYLDIFLHTGPRSTDISSSTEPIQLTEGYTPQSQFRLRSFVNVTPKIEFDNSIFYVGGLNQTGSYAYSANSQSLAMSKGTPSYVRLDTRLGYLATKTLDVSVGVQNLLDQVHSEFKAALYSRQTEIGRTIYAKLVWQY